MMALPETPDRKYLWDNGVGNWLGETWRPLTALMSLSDQNDFSSCYTGGRFFFFLHQKDPGLLPAWFEELGKGRDAVASLDALARQRGLGTIGHLYSLFAAEMYIDWDANRNYYGPHQRYWRERFEEARSRDPRIPLACGPRIMIFCPSYLNVYRDIRPTTSPLVSDYMTVEPFAVHYIAVTLKERCTVGIRVEGPVSAWLVTNRKHVAPLPTDTDELTVVEDACTPDTELVNWASTPPYPGSDVMLAISSNGTSPASYRVVTDPQA